MKARNLTPHTLRVVTTHGNHTLEPEGHIVTGTMSPVVQDLTLSTALGFPVIRGGEIDPATVTTTAEILAGQVVVTNFFKAFALARKYPDSTILYPDTSPNSVIRDETGKIIGVKRMKLAVP